MAAPRRAAISARTLALRCLRAIEQRKGFSNRILDEHLERWDLDPRDRALATLLVYGVLRHRARLDRHIDAAAHRPAKIKGEVREALRIACYELLELDRPLPIASAQAGSTLSKHDPSGRLKSLVGGILRTVHANAQTLQASWTTPLQQLCFLHSIPEWLAQRWIDALGPETALDRGRALAQTPWIDLRLGPGVERREDLVERISTDYPDATIERPADHPRSLRIRGAGDLHFGRLYQEGQFCIQALGSQQAAQALAVQPGEKVLDACCGQGTKTMQLLAALGGRGQLVAVDQNQTRLAQVRAQQTRLRLEAPAGGFGVHCADLLQHDALPEAGRDGFDAVLLDAPCTGLGNLARHPELRWTKGLEDVQDRVLLQQQLLRATLQRLRPGGRLVYAVCSLELEEGVGQMDWIRRGLNVQGRAVRVETQRTWTPEGDGCDGFFVGSLRLE